MTTNRIREKLRGFSDVPIGAFDELMLVIDALEKRVAKLEQEKLTEAGEQEKKDAD